MRRSTSPIAALAAVAYAVILGDLLTKLFAVELVADRSYTLLGSIRLGLVFNDEAGAFGLPSRAFGVEVSTIVVFVLILLMLRVCRELAAVDRHAPLMLGLLAGAGAANHMDMLASSRGVADFIAIDVEALRHIVFNVADIALAIGLVLCARTAIILIVKILEERSTAPAIAGAGRSGPGDAWRPAIRDEARSMRLFREPGMAHAFLAAADAAGSETLQARHSASDREGARRAGSDSASRRESGGWLSLPSRFDRAATPALVIACSFILLYSLTIVWLPDAGRSAPNALLLALGVFGTVFVAVYAELAIAERRAMREQARAAAGMERERPLSPIPSADLRREAPRSAPGMARPDVGEPEPPRPS